jgi:hypothetical protein
MRSALSWASPTRPGLGLALLATCWLGLATPAAANDFPEAGRLPARAELPDPLVMFDGRSVTSPEQWAGKRRPELKALFQYYMYGQMPPAPEDQSATVAREDSAAMGGKATLKEVTIDLGAADLPRIHLLVVVPNERKGPAPVFLGTNFFGNHAVVADPKVALPTAWMPERGPGVVDHKATDAGRGSQADVWAVDEVIGRGYALATFYCGDVAPDDKEAYRGVFPHYMKTGQTRPGPHDWGAVAAWAWGLSRAVDYLATDGDIDRGRIAVVGHSRLGKAAIVAAAFDERIALVIPHQAGCGGTSPSRGKVGESVQRINTSFPHWFDAEFKNFNEAPERLPFDQNCLVALVAPRPVLMTNATADTWANPEGQFQVLQAAEPVYRLLGAGGLDAKSMPEVNTLINSTLGYHIRPGKHSMGREDWAVFLKYADTHLGRAPSR